MPDDLVQRLLSRDLSALDLLVRLYVDRVHHLAGWILGQAGTPEDVEEVAADVFARAWERIAQYDPHKSTLAGWLLMITKYTALDRRRKLQRQRYTADGEAKVIPLEPRPEPAAPDSPEEEALLKDQGDALREAMDSLSQSDRELLIRRYFCEEPIAEIARDLGLTRTAIDNRLSRARQALRARMAGKKGVSDVV
ncbi:MAG TPA: sigma-70 family RNA polymerase sigma factor [Symbiobacteriaceae bacterium]|nr:sigma-70 family RNA polymerase sigma factor [Symbiobacteriaceae bacterium]